MSAKTPAGLVAHVLAVSCLLVAPLSAGVLVVDPADPLAYPQIQAAIDAAVPHDVIAVRPLSDPLATYDAIVIENTGTLAIVGMKDLGPVRVAGATLGAQPLGDVVILRALDFVAPLDLPAMTIASPDGSVCLEDCTLAGGAGDVVGPAAGLLVDGTFSLVVTRCTLTGGAATSVAHDGAPALVAALTKLSVRNCTLSGGAGASSAARVAEAGSRGGPGAQLTGGKILFTNSTVNGGQGGLPGCVPLTECDCGSLGAGGDAIVMSATVLTLETCELVPGLGAEMPCGPLPGGEAGLPVNYTVGVVQEIADDPHLYYMSSPCYSPVLATFHAEGVLWEALYLSASTFPLHKYMYKYDGDLLLGLPNLMDFKLLRVFDVEPAIHDTTHPIPPPPAAGISLIGYTQAVFVNLLAPSEVHLGDLSVFLYTGFEP